MLTPEEVRKIIGKENIIPFGKYMYGTDGEFPQDFPELTALTKEEVEKKVKDWKETIT
jgi:hypothetical protein